jgi:hypothetical protein
MTAFLVIAALMAAFIAIVLLLPCKACQARRARLQAAYGRWRETRADVDD